MEHALRQVARAGDREVPGEVELTPRDAAAGQRGEETVHVMLAIAVTVAAQERGERRRGVEHGTDCDAKIAQRHDVTPTVLEVARRTNDQRAPGISGGVGVELGPVRLAPTGAGVEQDDRCIATE